MNAIILGDKSDIAQAIKPMLEKDGYTVYGWSRDQELPSIFWDLMIITLGKVAPVGLWHEQGHERWDECMRSNLLLPLKLLRRSWGLKRKDATVIWFAGSNPQKIMDGYSAYNTSKMAVLKLIEQLDHETPDCKFVAFGPGYAKTKIHEATLKANWPNERIARGDDGTSMEDIYKAMKWCIDATKFAVGGRNICVSDIKDGEVRLDRVLHIPVTTENAFKLRRIG